MVAQHLDRLVMICPTLVDRGGHEYEYTHEIARVAAAQGLGVITLIPQRTREPVKLPGHVEQNCPKPSKNGPGRLLWPFLLLQSWCAVFGGYGKAGTIFFVHSIPQRQLAIVALAWLISGCRDNRLALFLRHQVGCSVFDRLFILLMSLGARGGIRFVTDSFLLADSFSERLGTPLAVLPIPVPSAEPRGTSAPWVCGYFGARRRNKGFHTLPGLVQALTHEMPDMAFKIQAYEHRDDKHDGQVDGALHQLRDMQNVDLTTDILDGEEFNRRVGQSHLALVPYDPAIYRYGTSSNFVMSVVARSVVLVTEGGWMAEIAKKVGMSRVVFMPYNAQKEDYTRIAKQVAILLKSADEPSRKERDWCASQTADTLWRVLSNHCA